MLSRRQFSAALLSLAAMPALSTVPAEAAVPSLHRAARSKGRFFGAAVRIDQLKADKTLRAQVASQCGALTPEIHTFWNSIENKKGQFWFEPVDELVAFGARHGMDVHGHAVLWEQCTPGWAIRAMQSKRDWSMVENHITRLVGRYRKSIRQWNIINEPIDTVRGVKGLRRNVFFSSFGADYIPNALHAARAASPNAQLMVNDYSFEYGNHVDRDRRTAFLKLLEKLKKQGVPLDIAGVQAHLDLGKGALATSAIRSFFKDLAGLGLDIVITELDVKERDYRASAEERDRRVSDEVARYLDVALDERAVKGVVTWGLSDKHSWLKVEPRDLVDRRRFGQPAPNRGLPYDVAMREKPMHSSLSRCLSGARTA